MGCPCCIVDAFEFHQCCLFVTKTVFLEEEWHKKSFCFNEDIVGLDTVEHIISEMKGQFTLHPMCLTQSSYLECLRHLLIFFPLNVGTEFTQSLFDSLVTTVNLFDVGDAALTVGTKRGDEQCDTRTDVGT